MNHYRSKILKFVKVLSEFIFWVIWVLPWVSTHWAQKAPRKIIAPFCLLLISNLILICWWTNYAQCSSAYCYHMPIRYTSNTKLIPLFWTSGNVCPVFQSQGGSFACFLACVILRFTSGVTPADCIEVSMAVEPFQSTYFQTCLQVSWWLNQIPREKRLIRSCWLQWQ